MDLPPRKSGAEFILAYEARPAETAELFSLVTKALEEEMSRVRANIGKRANVPRSGRSHKLVEKAEIDDCIELRGKRSELKGIEGDELGIQG